MVQKNGLHLLPPVGKSPVFVIPLPLPLLLPLPLAYSGQNYCWALGHWGKICIQGNPKNCSSCCGHPTVLAGLDTAFSSAVSVWQAGVTRPAGNLFRNTEMFYSPHGGGTPLCQAPGGTSQHEPCGSWGDLVLTYGAGAHLMVTSLHRKQDHCQRKRPWCRAVGTQGRRWVQGMHSQNVGNGLACLAVEVQLRGRWESCTRLREK